MTEEETDWEDWHALVVRSELDPKVWVGVLPDSDHNTNMMASTSIRKVKAYCKDYVTGLSGFDFQPEDLKWVHRDNDDWELVEKK